MAILLPLGIKSGAKSTSTLSKWLKNLSYLFVNPESLQLKREASVAETRTMGGTVFQPWPNQPDRLEFSGILYGLKSVVDCAIFDAAIPESPNDKQVELIYKWRKFPGYVKSLSISANVDKPRVYNYTFSFVSKEAVPLWRMLMGQLTTIEQEREFISGQAAAVKASVKGPLLNTMSTAALLIPNKDGGFNLTSDEVTAALARTVILFALGNSLDVSRSKSKKWF